MKKILTLGILLFLFIVSCKKENQSEFNGTITGYDLRECACCGGYFITIENAVYRFDSIPVSSGIDPVKDSFPIFVIVKWHKKSPQCLGDEIIIDHLRKK